MLRIVPVEIVLCLTVFISKKYFTLDTLNKVIEDFPFKWTDRTNRPHPVPLTYASRKSIGGKLEFATTEIFSTTTWTESAQ